MKRNATDWTAADAMSDDDIHKAAVADPDAQPLTRGQLARAVRMTAVKRLRISQTEFAEAMRSGPTDIGRTVMIMVAVLCVFGLVLGY